MEKDSLCKLKQKESWGSLIADEVDFKTKSIIKDKDKHYVIIKGSIKEQDIAFINIYTPSIGPPKYIKQILTNINGESDNNNNNSREI